MSEINNRGDVEERLHTEITHLKSELEKCQSACACLRDALNQSFLDRLHTSEQRVKELSVALNNLYSTCTASDFNEHWESYKNAFHTLHKAIGEVGSK